MFKPFRAAAAPFSRLSPVWRARLAVGALLALATLLLGAIVMSWQAARHQDLATKWEVHTLEVLDATARLQLNTLATVRGERGYLLTHDPGFLEPFDEGRAGIETDLARLITLVADSPGQRARLARLEGRIDYHTGTMAMMIALEREGKHDEAIARIRAGEGKRATDQILTGLEEFEQVERNLLVGRTSARERWSRAEARYQSLLGGIGLFLLALGTWAALALRQSMKREAIIRRELERYALTDELTGLANRRETLASLDRQIATARRHGRPLSIAILDIDHFKKVNDTYGHPVGDQVIRRVGDLATEIMRDQDLVGRLGGEEFVIVLPETDADGALIACDRLRQAIADAVLEIETGETLSVTLSAGVAQMVPQDERTQLIARADAALYDAKTSGRDRVLLAA